MRAIAPLLALLIFKGCRKTWPPSDCGDESPDTCRIETLEVDGAQRTWLFSNRFPPDCSAGRVPLLVFFHGSDSNGMFARTDYAFFEEEIGTRARLIYPDGLGRPELGGSNGWNLDPDGNDVRFVEAMLPVLTAEACVDPSRVFAVGHSRGGRFTEVLGCHRPNLFRGLAEASAGGGNVKSCPGQSPFLIAHGVDDQQVAYADGLTMRDNWASRNGCAAPGSNHPVGICTALDCPAATPVTWCPYEGAIWRGHYLPDFFAREVWAFFERL